MSRFFFDEKKDDDLFELLGYLSNNDVYKKAFIHKSFNQTSHNEQLEFLGDAILSLIVAEFLFLENSKKEEGFLSQKRAAIVARKHLNLVGRKIIPEGKIKSNLKKLPSNIFGNTLEAIIGAIYIDKGIKQTRVFVRKNIYNSEFLQETSNIDFKSRLLKYSQKERVKIEYKLEKKEGPDHQQVFLVAVFINNKKIAEAKASSKKQAEQSAAKKAINSVFLT